MTRGTSATTTRFALSPAEWMTTAFAAAVSTGAYLAAGQAYLSRGVVGDLLGLLVLAAVGVRLRARLRHEALLCLLMIGLVLAVGPLALAVPEPMWWALFLAGLSGYLVLRRRLCRAAHPCRRAHSLHHRLAPSPAAASVNSPVAFSIRSSVESTPVAPCRSASTRMSGCATWTTPSTSSHAA